MKLSAKIAAFCRELDDTALADMASQQKDMEPVYRRAEESVRAGRVGPELEADLDALDAMARRVDGQGLYPSATRYVPLPGSDPGSGAQWWACPRDLCAGRGRVMPGRVSPLCAAAGMPLVAGPLPG
ncbi:MAG TPA: hypothetical protein VMU95_03860 [Trebonia sp.]|nr:hypothetical protein [Trebonia sp.]